MRWTCSILCELLYRIFSFSVRMHLTREKPIGALPDTSDLERSAFLVKAGRDTLRIWLRKKLRTFPYWTSGHIHLGELSLEDNDIGAAYASSQAALALSPSRVLAGKGHWLLGTCYVRRGHSEEALQHLKEAQSILGPTPSLLMEIGAAQMGVGEFPEVVKTLSLIPDEKLSPEGKIALEYAKRKLGS